MLQVTREMWDAVQKEALEIWAAGGSPDPHRMLAAKCFGVPEDRVTDEMRQAAKSAAHIYAYSNGPSKFKKIGLVQ